MRMQRPRKRQEAFFSGACCTTVTLHALHRCELDTRTSVYLYTLLLYASVRRLCSDAAILCSAMTLALRVCTLRVPVSALQPALLLGIVMCIILPHTRQRRPLQAWGLTELQAGNALGAVKLIQRCVQLDPSLAAVMRWQCVQAALTDAEELRRARKQAVKQAVLLRS
jgi:hypothetical protein